MAKTLLIVDDEAQTCALLSRFFESYGFHTRTAQSGREALEALRHETPDYLLLDIRMPDLSGLDVLKRAKQEHPGLKVVVVTGSDDVETAKEAMRLGAMDYIVKPFSFDTQVWARAFFSEETRPEGAGPPVTTRESAQGLAAERDWSAPGSALPTRETLSIGGKVLLGELLIQQGLLTPEQLDEALSHQAKTKEYLGLTLVRLGFVTEAALLAVLAEQLSIPSIQLAEYHVPPDVLAKVPAKVATQYRLLPLRKRTGPWRSPSPTPSTSRRSMS